jgi:predicted phosphodiesterase
MPKLVFISDTHNKHAKVTVPPCDILVHCGDFTFQGARSEVLNFAQWLHKQPAKHIIVIPGNHEKIMEACLQGVEIDSKEWILRDCPRAKLLIHQAIEIDGIKFFGSPWTPYFFNWAWNAGRTVAEAGHVFKPFIGDLWKDIPLDTNVLVTHGPPIGILDQAMDRYTGKLVSAGCYELSEKIKELKDLKVHAFGHLHLNGGSLLEQNGVQYINASICDEDYRPLNKVMEVQYEQ